MDDGFLGRETQLAAVSVVLERLQISTGSALVFRGPAGIGKTSLLRSAEALARALGVTTLSVSAVQSETHVPFAGVGQLLGPVLRHSAGERDDATALITAAIGGSANSTDVLPHRVALAALEVLSSESSVRPVCLTIDDVHWLDQQSWDVLSFVARRVDADPIAIFMAARDGPEMAVRLSSSRLPESLVGPLSDLQAGVLVERVAPDLSPALKRRVIEEAGGNPLGVLELSAAASRADATTGSAPWLPLTERLEEAYSTAVSGLPSLAKTLLLVAAVNDSDQVGELLAAASKLAGRRVGLEACQPAVDAGLVTTNGFVLQFRHPLIRSAVQQSADVADRLAAHAAIAEVLAPDSDRAVWHRALATTGPDEAIARRLAEIGARARRQGALKSAMNAWERSAALSENPQARADRWMWAAGTADEIGDTDGVKRLFAQIDTADLQDAQHARYLWLRESVLGEGWSGETRLARLASLVEQLTAIGDHDLALDSLENAALRYWWTPPSQEDQAAVLELADRLDVPSTDTRLIRVVALAAPVARGGQTLARLAHLVLRPPSYAPQLLSLGESASGVGDYESAALFLQAAVDEMRQGGQVGLLMAALTSQAWVAAHRGEARLAVATAGEAYDLAVETGKTHWAVSANLTLGLAEALRGNVSAALTIADEEEQRLRAGGRHPFLCLVQAIRGVALLADGRPADAFDHLARLFEPADPARHPYAQLGIVGHLVEAGSLAGRGDQLRPIIDRCRDVATEAPWPVLLVTLRFARAVLPGDQEAAFTEALDHDLSAWSFERARLQLAYGGWLRRQRRQVDSRPVLRAAQQTFQALGATPWAERARHELRASGEAVRHAADRTGELTAQELKIAQLAASGLSNQEIARQLFLSPRTVSTHLYRIYPKVGVRSRSGLSDALRGE